jgi:Tfp pilus assembly protein PilE
MIVVAILSVIAGIAIPLYNAYILEARLQAVRQNVEPLRLALEDFYLDNLTYVTGNWIPGGSTTLEANLGWRPDGDADNYSYAVTTPTGGGAITTGYTLTVSDASVSAATVTCTRIRATGSFTCI